MEDDERDVIASTTAEERGAESHRTMIIGAMIGFLGLVVGPSMPAIIAHVWPLPVPPVDHTDAIILAIGIIIAAFVTRAE